MSKSNDVIVLWPLVGFLLGRKKKPAAAMGALGHQQSEYTNTMFQPPLSCLTPNRFKTIHHKAAGMAHTESIFFAEIFAGRRRLMGSDVRKR